MRNFLLTLVGVTFLMSCSGDDDGGSTTVTDPSGTYLQISYITNPAADFNGDGTTSFNQLEEIVCFDTNQINLLPDGAALLVIKDITFDLLTGAGTYICSDEKVLTGTYTFNNGIVDLTYTDDGQTINQQYTAAGSTIKRIIVDTPVIRTQNDNGDFVINNNGQIEIVYRKE
ncbi:MAG: hypothetical protein HRT68_11815 [Flavobacteriaceae bacterium]|nr:hypothetical protein [Flavobacteriaceae bacterium]